MNTEKLQDAIGEVKDSFIQDADTMTVKKNHWIKWVAAAACLVLLVMAGVLIVSSVIRKGNGSGEAGRELAKTFEKYGLSAEILSASVRITGEEVPYSPKEEVIKRLQNAEAILDCTIEEITRLKVQEPGSGNVWYITSMTLSLNEAIRGSTEEKSFRVVNAAVTNAPVEFLSYPGLEECAVQSRVAVVLKNVGENEFWTIGGKKVAVKEFGDYSVVRCMGYDGKSLHYMDYDILLTELD